MAKKVARTTTQYGMTVQRRDGKAVAVIDAEIANVFEDGRGYAGQVVADRQVLVVPLSSLADLADQIVRTLAYDMTADPEERYDLTTDAVRRIGLYSPDDHHKPVETFYTVVEARVALRKCPPGRWAIAHLPAEGESLRDVIETNLGNMA